MTEPHFMFDDFICYAIYSANHAISKVYAPHLESIGLTYPQYIVMVALWEQDNQTVGSLGRRVSMETNTLTPLLKRLEAAGFVNRARDKKDERQVRVTLTPTGLALRQQAAPIQASILAASGLSLDDLEALQNQVVALREALLESAARSAAEPRP
jgi:DNA-binding MarR family transcriptional regulator